MMSRLVSRCFHRLPGAVAALAALALIASAPSWSAPDGGGGGSGGAVADQPVILTAPVGVTVNAMALGAVDLSRPIALRLMDDSPANRAMLARLTERLTARGLTLVAEEDQAALLLEVDTAASQAPHRPDPDEGALSVTAQAGTGQDEDQVAVRLRLFSNTQVSLLGGDRDAPPPPLGGPGLRLDAGLTDRATGRRLWQGWATATAPTLDQATVGRILAGPLAATLGEAARHDTLTLPAGPLVLP